MCIYRCVHTHSLISKDPSVHVSVRVCALVCEYAGAKVGGYTEPGKEASPFSAPASFPPWLWLPAYCQAQHEQPRPWLVLLWRKQGLPQF